MSSAGALASSAAEAHAVERRLKNTVASIDGQWKDKARRDFDQRYLDQILYDASHLAKELDQMSAQLAKAAGMAGL